MNTNNTRVLVVDDNHDEIEGAKIALAERGITPVIVSGFDQALEKLEIGYDEPKEPKFDVVLTDVMFPKGGDRCMSDMGMALAKRQGEMPYGPLVALRAIQSGVKKIGIVTAGNHHDDPFVFAFDNLHGFEVGELKVVCTNRHDVCLDKKAGKIVDYPGNNDKEAYAEFRRRQEAGEIVWVKDWGKIYDELVS